MREGCYPGARRITLRSTLTFPFRLICLVWVFWFKNHKRLGPYLACCVISELFGHANDVMLEQCYKPFKAKLAALEGKVETQALQYAHHAITGE